MRRRLAAGLLAAIGALASIGGAEAAAATEFGNDCTATGGSQVAGVVQLAQAPGRLPMLAPKLGVITKWQLNVGPGMPEVPLRAMVLRSTGTAASFTVVAVSAQVAPRPGANAFETRLPVAAGDRVGLSGDPLTGILYCPTSNDFDKVAALFPGSEPGSTVPIELTDEGLSVPLVALVEPDADGDGYGDETQDRCPQSAATQAVCPPPGPPPIRLATFPILARGAVTVLVAGDSASRATVTGTVKLGKKGKPLTLRGGTKALAATAIVPFRLELPPRVRERLAALPRKRALGLKIGVAAVGASGQSGSRSFAVRLKGRGPAPR